MDDLKHQQLQPTVSLEGDECSRMHQRIAWSSVMAAMTATDTLMTISASSLKVASILVDKGI